MTLCSSPARAHSTTPSEFAAFNSEEKSSSINQFFRFYIKHLSFPVFSIVFFPLLHRISHCRSRSRLVSCVEVSSADKIGRWRRLQWIISMKIPEIFPDRSDQYRESLERVEFIHEKCEIQSRLRTISDGSQLNNIRSHRKVLPPLHVESLFIENIPW